MVVDGAEVRLADPVDGLQSFASASPLNRRGAFPNGLLLQLGQVGFRVLAECLETRLAAEFHDGAIMVVDVRFAHTAQFLTGDDADLQGVVVDFGALVRTALKAAPKEEGQASKGKIKDR